MKRFLAIDLGAESGRAMLGTLGGGRVLDPFAPARQRRSPERLAQLRVLAISSELEQALPTLLEYSASGLDPQRQPCARLAAGRRRAAASARAGGHRRNAIRMDEG